MASSNKVMNSIRLKVIKLRSGQALVEAIVALGLLIVGFMAILSLLNNSLSASSTISNQVIATYLAAEGIEVVKNLVGANILNSQPFNDNFQQGSYEVEVYQELVNPAAATPPYDKNPGKRIGAWNDYSNTYLNFDSSSHSYTYISGTPTHFKRTIKIFPPTNDKLHVASIVRWDTKGGGTSETKLEDFFFPI